jgi:HK97 family phage major capsid protein
MTTKELREKRGRLAEEANGILTKAHEDQRELLSDDEEQKWQAIHKDIDSLARHIEMQEKQDALERSLAETQGRKTEPTQPRNGNGTGTGDEGRDSRAAISRLTRGQEDINRGLRAWFLSPAADPGYSLSDEDKSAAQRVGINLASRTLTFNLSTLPMRSLRQRDWDYRALAVGTPAAGGYTVPDETMRGIEKALLTFGGMRARSTVIRTTTGADLPWPMTNDTANKGEIIGENLTANEQDVAFAQLVLQSYLYSSKIVRVSYQLMQDSSVNVPALLGDLLGERIGRILNDHFTVGTGTGQPLGIVPAAPIGFTTPATDSQVTTWKYGSMVEMEHSIDPAYRTNAAWMMNDSSLKKTKLMVDTAGRPIWAAGIAEAAPDTLLGYPVVINQSMANMAANAKAVLFGDLSKYLIRDVLGIQLVRLDERYAEYHQVAFLAYSRHDGDLLNAGTGPVKVMVNAAT